MNNKFINYNGETLLHTKNKKTQVENRIENLKQQKKEINEELWSWETKKQKADQLLGYLEEVNQFSTKHLAEALKKAQKEKENCDDWWLEILIENKVKFALKFGSAKEAFYQLVFQKIENQISYLKSQLRTIQDQLSHQERIFARMEIRRQNRVLLTCKYKNRLGCLGVYRCDNCRANYSAEVATP